MNTYNKKNAIVKEAYPLLDEYDDTFKHFFFLLLLLLLYLHGQSASSFVIVYFIYRYIFFCVFLQFAIFWCFFFVSRVNQTYGKNGLLGMG
jgi:hypothetical protein